MDNFDPALISVVMPCHNAAPYVEAAVQSVLQQCYPHVELIVVDDASTDGSTDILQRLAAEHPGRITLLYQTRSGPFAARNLALAHAHGIGGVHDEDVEPGSVRMPRQLGPQLAGIADKRHTDISMPCGGDGTLYDH